MFLPDHEFWPFWDPSSPLTFHNVKNHEDGGAEGEPGGIAGNEEQKKTTQTGSGINKKVRVPKAGEVFTKNTAYARLGV